jgi:plasmid rolling circle replication initiator protein Rep
MYYQKNIANCHCNQSTAVNKKNVFAFLYIVIMLLIILPRQIFQKNE